MREPADIDKFIAAWRDTGGSELANTQSFINGLCQLLGVDAPAGSRTNDAHNACTLTAPTLGQCTYVMTAGDLPLPGTLNCDVEVTFASGKIETWNKYLTIIVRAEV